MTTEQQLALMAASLTAHKTLDGGWLYFKHPAETYCGVVVRYNPERRITQWWQHNTMTWIDQLGSRGPALRNEDRWDVTSYEDTWCEPPEDAGDMRYVGTDGL